MILCIVSACQEEEEGRAVLQKQLRCFNTNPTNYDDIINAFLKGETLTLRAICQRCDRAKTPRMLALVNDLVDAGILLKTKFTARNGVAGFDYSIINDTRED